MAQQVTVRVTDFQNQMSKYSEYFKRAADGEKQCEAVTSRGQCANVPMPGSLYCPAHGGNQGFTKMKQEQRKLYELGRYQKKIADMADSTEANSFRTEIAMLRQMLELRYNKCTDDHDLLMHSGPIGDMIMKIEKAVVSATKLELLLGRILTEEQAMTLIGEILEIVSSHVEDPQVLEEISESIMKSLEKVKNATVAE